jgi:hypothetical protein
MTVNNPGSINPLVTQTMVDLNTGKAANTSKPQESSGAGAIVDKIDISKKAKELSKALNAVNQMPDIRQEAIEKARQRLSVENHKVPASVLAAKMLLED